MKKHVCLIDFDNGEVLLHEELDEATENVRQRAYMLSLQGELNALDDKNAGRTVRGNQRAAVYDAWPPPGQKQVKRKGKLYLEVVPVEAPAAEAGA